MNAVDFLRNSDDGSEIYADIAVLTICAASAVANSPDDFHVKFLPLEAASEAVAIVDRVIGNRHAQSRFDGRQCRALLAAACRRTLAIMNEPSELPH